MLTDSLQELDNATSDAGLEDAADTGTGLEPMDASETGEGLEEPVKSPEEMDNGGTPNPKDDTHESSPVEKTHPKPKAKCKSKASKPATTRRSPKSKAKKIPVSKAAAKKSKTSDSKACAKAKANPKPNRSKSAKSDKTQRRGMRDDPVWKKMHSVSRLSQ